MFHRKEEELQDLIEELRHQAELAKTCSTCYAVDTGPYVCLPCGHRIACEECVRDVRVQASESCFTCRAPHTGQFLKVFCNADELSSRHRLENAWKGCVWDPGPAFGAVERWF